MVWQVMLADDDFDIDAEVARLTEDLDDTADGLLRASRMTAGSVFQQLDIDDQSVQFGCVGDRQRLGANAVDLSGGQRNRHVFGDFNPFAQALVLGDHEMAALRDAKLTDNRRMGALQNLKNFAVGFPVAFDAGDPDDGAISVHRAAGAIDWQIDIAGEAFHGPVWNEKSVAIPVHANAPHRELTAAGRGHEMAATHLDEIAAGHESLQRGLNVVALAALRAELAGELLEVGFGVRQASDVSQKRGFRHPWFRFPLLALFLHEVLPDYTETMKRLAVSLLALTSLFPAFGTSATVPRKAAEFVTEMPGSTPTLLSHYRGKIVVMAFMFTT